MKNYERVILVSALLPVSVKEVKRGEYQVRVSPGGLITTLSQSIKGKKVKWFGWYGFHKHSKKIEQLIKESGEKEGFDLYPVSLTEDEIENFFNNFSNGVIWPLFHTFPQYCRFEEEYWQYYKKVNEKFAEKILKNIDDNTVVWVHDYHFFLLPEILKKKKPDLKIYFFLHIPFPTFENFLKLPWRRDILHGLLHYDFIGFHTKIDRNNFITCVKHFFSVKEKVKEPVVELIFENKKIKTASIPISIDFSKYDNLARSSEVEKIYKELKQRYDDKFLILSIDRIDYTKGLVEKLDAYRRFLEKYPQYLEKVVLLVSTAPNVKNLPEYKELEREFHHKIAEINGTFGTSDWRPVHFINKRLDFYELFAYYRVSDVCFINSIKDGLNIVCKEYASSNIDETGAVLLSEFAGASTEIKEYVYLINPYDREGIADTLNSLLKETNKKREKMKGLREHISKFDIHWWGETYFKLAEGKKVKRFPKLMDFYPVHEQE